MAHLTVSRVGMIDVYMSQSFVDIGSVKQGHTNTNTALHSSAATGGSPV